MLMTSGCRGFAPDLTIGVVVRRTLDRLVPTALVAAVAAGLFAQTRHFGLLGFDSYPIIIASRIRSWADFVGTFSERLMDGRYASGFYRPMLNLTFAADHAAWGLNAVGYQLTNALLLAFCGLALWALLRRLLGTETWAGPVTGLLVFLLSPFQWEVLPVPARRGELLCCAFMALALALQLAPRALRSGRGAIAPAVATLLAVASKETAFILPALVFVAVVVYSQRETLRERIVHAASAVVPHAVAVGVMLIARLLVLGALGGHGSSVVPQAVGNTARFITTGLLWPREEMRTAAGWGLSVLLALALCVLPVFRALRTGGESRGGRSCWLKATAVPVTWVGLIILVYAIGQVDAWYALLPLAGWALFAGALFDGMLALSEDDDAKTRAVALITLVVLTITLVWQASYSPLVRGNDVWRRATAASEAFLTDARLRIETAAPGTVVDTIPAPYSVLVRGDEPSLRGVAILADYSVQAWAELALPERNVRVHHGPGDVRPPAPDEIVLRIPAYAYVD
jgi:hypothetical protein